MEKIKTFGDAYMAAAGLDDVASDPSAAAADLALDMLDVVRETDGTCQIRIGIHGGPLVAGVIGSRKFAYDLWGDTVNVASRLESTSVTNRIQVSQPVADALRDRYRPSVAARIAPRSGVTLPAVGPSIWPSSPAPWSRSPSPPRRPRSARASSCSPCCSSRSCCMPAS